VGEIYSENGQELLSFHFPTVVSSKGSQALILGKATARKTKEPYISYAGIPEEFNLLDGSKPPAKKYFEDPKYDSTQRVFTGKIVWGENTIKGVYSEDYRMVFSLDFSFIESGERITRDGQGKILANTSFGIDGYNYTKNSIDSDKA
jgi:hypothetical protein